MIEPEMALFGWSVKILFPGKKELDLGTPSKLRLKHSSSFAAVANKQINRSDCGNIFLYIFSTEAKVLQSAVDVVVAVC